MDLLDSVDLQHRLLAHLFRLARGNVSVWSILRCYDPVSDHILLRSYAPTLLRRRAIKMRKETGDDTIMTEQEHRRRPAGEVAREALLLPLVLLFTEPTMIFFSAYLCLIYGLLYSFFFAYPIVFEGLVHLAHCVTCVLNS